MPTEKYVAVLDPFSEEGKEIVKESPPFDDLSERIIDRAVEMVETTSGSEVRIDFDEDEVRDEVLSFYLACQAMASVSYPYSNEVRNVIEAIRKRIRYRLYDLFRRGYEDLCMDVIGRSFRYRELDRGDGTAILGGTEIPSQDLTKLRDMELEKDGIGTVDEEILEQYFPKYAIRWTDLIPLIEHRQIELTDQYIVDGWALITPKKLWSFFANYIESEVEDYVGDLYDKFTEDGTPSDILEEVGERISENLPEEVRSFGTAEAKGGDLRRDCFPPCVKMTMQGVGEGNRNYGIIVLLTSFLSYARISPSGKSVNRVADFVDDISVIEDDVIPLIFEAAENCKPPLFKDQPQDKANVYYHMGFGMPTQPRLRDSGKSKWYRPPNCRKIKTESPALCNPDELCSEVKNPLTYYYKKLSKSSDSEED